MFKHILLYCSFSSEAIFQCINILILSDLFRKTIYGLEKLIILLFKPGKNSNGKHYGMTHLFSRGGSRFFQVEGAISAKSRLLRVIRFHPPPLESAIAF